MPTHSEAPMDLSLRSGLAHERRAGMAVLLLFEGDGAGRLPSFERATGGALARLLGSGDFTGRWLETAMLYPIRGSKPARVMVVGLGRRGDLTPHRLLQAVATAARRGRSLRARRLAVPLP